jgi:molecular chaperone GrpE
MTQNKEGMQDTGDKKEKHARGKKPAKSGTQTGSAEKKQEELIEEPETWQEDEDPLQILAEKIREQDNKYLRLAAEYDNYRKRTLREKAELTKTAGAEIIAEMLPVVDDLDRAIEAMAGTGDADAIRKGVELIHGKFKDFLSRRGVKEIESMGAGFDTDYHEAVARIPAPDDKTKGKIVDVVKKGYMLNDKVIRYAKVVIGE